MLSTLAENCRKGDTTLCSMQLRLKGARVSSFEIVEDLTHIVP